MMRSYSVFHIEQKIVFDKFNWFFDRGWRRVYTRHNATDLLCISIDWFLYDKKFYWTVFLNRLYNYILENHFYFVNAPDYCFKPSLSRIFWVSGSVKVLSSRYEGPSTHLSPTTSLCSFIIYRKKEIDFVAKFSPNVFLGPKANPNDISS